MGQRVILNRSRAVVILNLARAAVWALGIISNPENTETCPALSCTMRCTTVARAVGGMGGGSCHGLAVKVVVGTQGLFGGLAGRRADAHCDDVETDGWGCNWAGSGGQRSTARPCARHPHPASPAAPRVRRDCDRITRPSSPTYSLRVSNVGMVLAWISVAVLNPRTASRSIRSCGAPASARAIGTDIDFSSLSFLFLFLVFSFFFFLRRETSELSAAT